MCCDELHLFMKTFDPSFLLKMAAIQRLGIKRFRSSYYVHFLYRSNFIDNSAQKHLLRTLPGDGIYSEIFMERMYPAFKKNDGNFGNNFVLAPVCNDRDRDRVQY